MSVELWLGHEFDTSHEMKALAGFLARMSDLYDRDDELYLVFANFFCQGEQIDLAVFKRNGIAIVELKEACDRVVGRENGPWTATGPDGQRRQLNDARRRNPFEQVRAYRVAMIAQLQQDSGQFLPDQKARQMRLDHVSGLVAFCPEKHPETDVQVSGLKWFSVVGLDELPQELYYQRSPALNFSKAELHRLAQTWRLRRTEIDKLLAGGKYGDALEVREPVITVQAARTPAGELDSWKTMTGGDKAEKHDNCIVCKYQSEPCDVPELRGVITGVADRILPNGCTLGIRTDGGREEVIEMADPHWAALVPWISRLTEVAEAEGAGREVRVVAYHLTQFENGPLQAGPESLVILEPDWLINVSDLMQIEYCPRQYVIDRFAVRPASQYTVRGNIVHRTFEQILQTPDDDKAVAQALKDAFFEQVRDLAVLDQSKASMWEQVKPHHERLRKWVRREHLPPHPLSETFLLAPQLGMKGRIDTVWRGDQASLIVGELKTGKSYGAKPHSGHAFQTTAYSLMALARGWSNLSSQQAWILYTGNPEMAQSLNVKREVSLSPAAFREVVDNRNRLVLIDYLADAPYELAQPNKCWKCTNARSCEEMTVLLGHRDPHDPELTARYEIAGQYEDAERKWFRIQADLVGKEFRAVKAQHAALWQRSPEERCEDGSAVAITQVMPGRENGGGRWVHQLSADNGSELHEEDAVLASDGRGPMDGNIAEGTVKRAIETGLEVEFKRALTFTPKWVDRYVTEDLAGRQFAGPYLWLKQAGEYRELVTRQREPRFGSGLGVPRFPAFVGNRALNLQQKRAVIKALQMEDYLLIQGPPGAGKTTLISALVREFIASGQRVLLSAGTNTAVDNVVKALAAAGLGEHL